MDAEVKGFRFDGVSVHCGCSESWPSGIVERFVGDGGQNLIFVCHFCGAEWRTSTDVIIEGNVAAQGESK